MEAFPTRMKEIENAEIKTFKINASTYNFLIISDPSLIIPNNLWARIWPSSLLLSSLIQGTASACSLGFDLGAGMGMNSILLAEFCQKVVGVDMIKEGLELGKQSAKLNKRENVDFEKFNWNWTESLNLDVDLLVSADCLYLSNSLKPIASVAKDLLLDHHTNDDDGAGTDTTRKNPGIGLFVSPCRGFEQDFCQELISKSFKVQMFKGSFKDLPAAIIILCYHQENDLLVELRQRLIGLEFVESEDLF